MKIWILIIFACALVFSGCVSEHTSTPEEAQPEESVPEQVEQEPLKPEAEPSEQNTIVPEPAPVLEASADSCIHNTKSEADCKDCCDCLAEDADSRKTCRDSCATHEFSLNTGYIAVDALSVLGPDGDYSSCTSLETEQECKNCCDGSDAFSCGDRRYCRDQCNTQYKEIPEEPQEEPTQEPEQKENGNSQYSIEQAISDKAQEATIAFDALAFLTGNQCADSFLPPGKVADFFGYQYLRDTTQAGMGHSTDFVTNSANNVLAILNDEQKAKMIALAKTQPELTNEFAYKRFVLMDAFRRNMEEDLPSGTSELSKEAVIAYSADLYELDGEISMQRAELFGEIIRSLNSEQKAALDAMVEGGFDSWETLPDQIDKSSLSHEEHVLVMTYASEMFGWYAGSVEADTYFCPERQGTYFGSFYMKDAPAMGNAGYVIDESITGNKGETFLSLLEPSQSELVTGLVDIQRDELEGIVEVRREISTELRKYLVQDNIDEDYVLELSRTYGELDGELVYFYAIHFAEVEETLTPSQKEDLMELRDLEDYPCEEGYIYVYSEKVSAPEIESSDFLFR